ncbi:MAG TPA: FAD-linked oxidase C-terminal domain-containing protein [Acidimicrobiales bacterium]|nr:FAD-linked oxidase C-terminal domain-containing protein [Acidimicrobiales bacterium]
MAVDVARLEAEMAARVDGEVRFDAMTRGAYSTDGSNYRQTPIGVVIPRTVDAGAEAIAVCRDFDVPVFSRGGGTSLGGQCTNVAVVIDWSKYCNQLLSVDASRRTCVVEPGIVLDELNDQLKDYQLEFGPKPATHDHCTIGGMIGNNSCGSTAQRTGKVVDNLARLEVLLYDGTRMWVGPTDDEEYGRIVGDGDGDRRAEVYRALRAVRDEYGELIRRTYPDIPRRVSGYNLDSLLPENQFDIARMLVGSESTLVTVLRAELRLVPTLKAKTLVMLGYDDIASAGDAVPGIVECAPVALEGLDDVLIKLERRKHLHAEAVDLLPKGNAWLLVQFGGDTAEQADDAAAKMLASIGRSRNDDTVVFYDDPNHEEELWAVREAGLGATAHVDGVDYWPGWEDSAVAPEDVGDYLRELLRLFAKYHYDGTSVYGHFGQGCVHCSIPFDLVTAKGVADFHDFTEEAARLVHRFGGSLSGEHGDGQARGDLLGIMFGDDIVDVFRHVKTIFDPHDRMNPGKVVEPNPRDGQLRLGVDYRHVAGRTYFAFAEDEGDFARAALRCAGVGKCRHADGGVMCPSYMVTKDEVHSTRGRSRLLFEMLDGGGRGGAISDGWRSTEVRDALDLCLSCKGCKRDCPVSVDMATYKAEFLAHHYARRLRPASHYSMGWLPLWAQLASGAPRAVNAAVGPRPVADLAKRVGGIAPERQIPRFAPESLRRWAKRRAPSPPGARGRVLLWPDTFTNAFSPEIGRAAVAVLEAAGWAVDIPTAPLCCGLTWISTGQLGVARRVLRRTVRALSGHVRTGGLVLGLEPSCTAVFRSDAAELLPGDNDVSRLAQATVTFAELLHDHSPGWEPPPLDGTRVRVQTHCHQHAILGNQADVSILQSAGADLEVLDSGCCGLAGNFGFERGHYDVSMACAERVLLPELREAAPGDVALADGFSCRTQIEQSGVDATPLHLAQLLWASGGVGGR